MITDGIAYNSAVNHIQNVIWRIFAMLTGTVFVITLIGIVAQPHHLSPDAALYLEIGQNLLDGELPYVDYEENNFPTIHFLNTVPAALARVTDWPLTVTFQISMMTLLFTTMGLIFWLFRDNRPVCGAVLWGLAVVSWFLMVIFQWGQREHFFVLFYLPFLVLRILRREDKPIGWPIGLMIGLLAGIGISIKPFFVVAAVLVEIVGVLVSRRWFIRTPEIAGIALIAGLHVVYFAFNPNIFQAFIILISRLGQGYAAYIPAPWEQQVFPLLFHGLTALIPFVIFTIRYRYRLVSSGLMLALSAMGIGTLIGVTLQGKGWFYHTIPVLFTSAIIWILLVAEGVAWYSVRLTVKSQQLVKMTLITAAVFGSAGIILFGLRSITGKAQAAERLLMFHFAPYVETYTQRGEAVMFVNTEPGPAYPMLPSMNRRNASRYPMVQVFPVAYYQYPGAHYTDPAHVIPDHMQEYLANFAEDMRQYQPTLVILRSDACAACRGEYRNLYDYLDARGVLAEVIAPDYDLLAVDSGFHVYLRKGATPNP